MQQLRVTCTLRTPFAQCGRNGLLFLTIPDYYCTITYGNIYLKAVLHGVVMLSEALQAPDAEDVQ